MFAALTVFMIFSPPAAVADVKTVIGSVVEKDGEIVIQSAEGTYILDGYVEKFIGLKVKATGELAKDDSGALILLVDSIEEAE